MTVAQPYAWSPQLGPQLTAVDAATWCHELFFGGAVFGGKSDYLLGDFAHPDDMAQGPLWQGIIFRRHGPELHELIRRSMEIYPRIGGQWKEAKKEWHWEDGPYKGVQLLLRHLENEKDVLLYMGHSYCVGEGTSVRMADGALRAIERVQVGDQVATLEGPRRVTATHDVGWKDCCEVRRGGEVLQVQPLNHRLLTTSAWQSYASLRDNDATATSPTSQESAPPLSVDALVAPGAHRLRAGAGDPHYDASARRSPLAGRWPISSYGIGRELAPQRRPLIADLRPIDESAQRGRGHSAWRRGVCDSACARPDWGREGGWQFDYSACRHPHGGRLLPPTDSDQCAVPSQGGAGGPCGYGGGILGVQGNIDIHTLQRLQYAHPYTGAQRTAQCEVSSIPLTLSPCGMRRVYDLTVEEVNHYITTAQSLISVNSWIGWDELPHMASLYPYKMMISRLRGPAKNKRIRATGNPGGQCHNEIKEYFGMGDYPEGQVPLLDRKSGMVRMFIPSRVQDNKIGLAQDPDYEDRLEAMADPELVRALKDGDWDAVLGNYFSKFRKDLCIVDPFEVPNHWPTIGCLDYGELAGHFWFGVLTRDFDGNVFVVDEYAPTEEQGGADHARGILGQLRSCPWLRQRQPEPERKVDLILAPSDMKIKRKPGEAKLETTAWDTFADFGLHLTPANMHRVQGWRNIKSLLYDSRLFFFRHMAERVVSSIATVQRDPKNSEDVLKEGDDHPADGLRYGVNHLWTPTPAKTTAVHSAQRLLDLLNQEGDHQRSKYG